MPRFKTLASRLVPVLALALLSACGSGGADSAPLVAPAGETDISCAALLYAANDLINDGKAVDPDGIIKDRFFGAMTHFATAHATAEKLEPGAVLGMVKLRAYRMTGAVPSPSGKPSATKVIDRAKACLSAGSPAVQ